MPTAIESWEVLDLLTGLVQKSLVVYEEDEQCCGRYRLLETVRQYSRDRLLESAEGLALRSRHREYYLARAEAAEPPESGQDVWAWAQRLELEHDNFRAALEWCRDEPGGAEDGLRLATALGRFWPMRHVREGWHWLSLMLGRPGAGAPTAVRARGLFWAGDLAAAHMGEIATARTLLEESVAICRALAEHQELASSLDALARVHMELGDYEDARRLWEECLSINRQAGQRLWAGGVLASLGHIHRFQGDAERARALYEESLLIGREVEDRGRIALSLSHLADLADDAGDAAAARALTQESLAIWRELRVPYSIAACLLQLANVLCEQGDYPAARLRSLESLRIRQEMENRSHIPANLESLGRIAACQEQPERAARLLGAAAALRAAQGRPSSPPESARCQRSAAAVRQQMGEAGFATAWARGQAMSVEEAIQFAQDDGSLLWQEEHPS